MEQAEQDRVQFTNTVLKCWPEIVKDGTLINLYQIEGVQFYGPFVLFAFAKVANGNLRQIPLHVFVPDHKLQDAKNLLAKYSTSQKQTDYHMLHQKPYENYRFHCGNSLFLSSEFGVTSFIDVYNITFEPKRGFEGTKHQQKTVSNKLVHIDPRLAKKILRSAESINRFFDNDCDLLNGFIIDWASQKWWRHVWKTALRDANFDCIQAFKLLTFQQRQKTKLTHPLLAIAVKPYLLFGETMRVSNSLFGCVFLSMEGFQSTQFQEQPIIEWQTIASSPFVLQVQFGEFMPAAMGNQDTVTMEHGPVFIKDLIHYESRKATKTNSPKILKRVKHPMPEMYTIENAQQLVRRLRDDQNTFAVFFTEPRKNITYVACYDFTQVTARKVYTCTGTHQNPIVYTKKEYWELNVYDPAKKPIIIEQNNWSIFQSGNTRYFILIELRAKVRITDAASFDKKQDEKDIVCEISRSVSGLMSVKIAQNTKIEAAVDKIFKQINKHLNVPPKKKKDSDTDTETTYSSSSSESDSDDERRVINEQHNPEY